MRSRREKDNGGGGRGSVGVGGRNSLGVWVLKKPRLEEEQIFPSAELSGRCNPS